MVIILISLWLITLLLGLLLMYSSVLGKKVEFLDVIYQHVVRLFEKIIKKEKSWSESGLGKDVFNLLSYIILCILSTTISGWIYSKIHPNSTEQILIYILIICFIILYILFIKFIFSIIKMLIKELFTMLKGIVEKRNLIIFINIIFLLVVFMVIPTFI